VGSISALPKCFRHQLVTLLPRGNRPEHTAKLRRCASADRTMNKCHPSIRSVLLPIHPLDTPAISSTPAGRRSHASAADKAPFQRVAPTSSWQVSQPEMRCSLTGLAARRSNAAMPARSGSGAASLLLKERRKGVASSLLLTMHRVSVFPTEHKSKGSLVAEGFHLSAS
jgi:hypothetical protein